MSEPYSKLAAAAGLLCKLCGHHGDQHRLSPGFHSLCTYCPDGWCGTPPARRMVSGFKGTNRAFRLRLALDRYLLEAPRCEIEPYLPLPLPYELRLRSYAMIGQGINDPKAILKGLTGLY